MTQAYHHPIIIYPDVINIDCEMDFDYYIIYNLLFFSCIFFKYNPYVQIVTNDENDGTRTAMIGTFMTESLDLPFC